MPPPKQIQRWVEAFYGRDVRTLAGFSKWEAMAPLSRGERWVQVGRVGVPLGLWIAHLFLPVIERPNPLPGWMQVDLIFWPAVGLLVMMLHGLFFWALGLSVFRRWQKALLVSLGAVGLLAVLPPGPIRYSGMQCLWGAVLLVLISAVVGIVRERQRGQTLGDEIPS